MDKKKTAIFYDICAGIMGGISSQGTASDEYLKDIALLDRHMSEILDTSNALVSRKVTTGKAKGTDMDSLKEFIDSAITPMVSSVNALCSGLGKEINEFPNTNKAIEESSAIIKKFNDDKKTPSEKKDQEKKARPSWTDEWKSEKNINLLSNLIDTKVNEGLSRGIQGAMRIFVENGLDVDINKEDLTSQVKKMIGRSGTLQTARVLKHRTIQAVETEAIEAGISFGSMAAMSYAENKLYEDGGMDDALIKKVIDDVSNMGKPRSISALYGQSTLRKYMGFLKSLFRNAHMSYTQFTNKNFRNSLTEDEKEYLANAYYEGVKEVFQNSYANQLPNFISEMFQRYPDYTSAFGSDAMKWVNQMYAGVFGIPEDQRSAEDNAFLYLFDPKGAVLPSSTKDLLRALVRTWTEKQHYIGDDGQPHRMKRPMVAQTIADGLISHLKAVATGEVSADWNAIFNNPNVSGAQGGNQPQTASQPPQQSPSGLPPIPPPPPSAVNLPPISRTTSSLVGMRKFADSGRGSGYAALYAAVKMFNDIHSLGIPMYGGGGSVAPGSSGQPSAQAPGSSAPTAPGSPAPGTSAPSAPGSAVAPPSTTSPSAPPSATGTPPAGEVINIVEPRAGEERIYPVEKRK